MCWKNYLFSPHPVRLRKPCNYKHYANAIATVSWMKYTGVHITIRMDKLTFLFPLLESQIKNIVKHTANITRFFSAVPIAFPTFVFVSLCSSRTLPQGLVSTDPSEWTREAFTLHQNISQSRSRMCIGGECVCVWQAHVYVCVPLPLTSDYVNGSDKNGYIKFMRYGYYFILIHYTYMYIQSVPERTGQCARTNSSKEVRLNLNWS